MRRHGNSLISTGLTRKPQPRPPLFVALMVVGTSLLLLPCASTAEVAVDNQIQCSSLGQVTLVAIKTGGKVQYRALGLLRNPNRLYYDLVGAKLLARTNGMEAILVGDKLLKRIRVARKEGGITRLVLDLQKPVNVVASQSANPYVFMIELRPALSVLGSRPVAMELGYVVHTARQEPPTTIGGRAIGSSGAERAVHSTLRGTLHERPIHIVATAFSK